MRKTKTLDVTSTRAPHAAPLQNPRLARPCPLAADRPPLERTYSFAEGDGIGGFKEKFLIAGEWTSSGNAGTKELTGEIEFEEFRGARKDLLPDLRAKTDGIGSRRYLGTQPDGVRTDREEHRAVREADWPGEIARRGDTIEYFRAEKVALADE